MCGQAYSKTNVRVVSAVLFLTLVLSFVFLVLCYTANGNVGDGLNTFVNETVFIGVQLVDRVEVCLMLCVASGPAGGGEGMRLCAGCVCVHASVPLCVLIVACVTVSPSW